MSVELDILWVGRGASAALAIRALEKDGLLKGLRLMFLDPDPKTRNDKTFCFWAEESESVVTDLQDLIGHSWDRAQAGNEPMVSIAPLRYYQVNSLDLYEDLSRRIEANGWSWKTLAVDDVGSDAQGPFAVCGTDKVRARWVLDSRPPQRPTTSQVQGNESVLLQSFYGWIVETKQPWPQKEGVTLMDLQVPQDGATQFVYILPYSENRVLVELTRFGTQILPAELAEQRLADYMAVVMKNQGDYRIVHREEGIIPMAEHPGENPNTFPGVLNLGTRNQALKPSTGYAFKTMYQQARDLAQHWSAFASANKDHHSLGSTTKPWKPQQAHPRYAFLDGLLLHILRQRPHQGKAIFEQLFAGSPLPSVLRFMDEKSGWQEDLRMFMHLPWKPFGVALWERHVGWPLRLMLLTLLLWGGQVCAASMGASGWYTVVANLGLALGMITLGLPHGAVDHLLQSGQLRKLPTAAMIAGYLGLGALMLGLWFWFPWWSLLFFVAYSAWHFGQADGRSWGLSAMASFAWGLSVLAYITGTHSEETSKIVEAMTHHASVWSLPTATMALWVGIGVVRQKSALVWTSLWLMIASQVPLMHAFGLYFIGQHSRTGWQDLKSGLQLNSRTLWKAALPFHAGAWLLLGLFYALPGIPSGFIREAQALAPLAIPQGWQGFGAEGTFFVFLACLSFPHVVTMHRFYRFGEGPKAQNMNQR